MGAFFQIKRAEELLHAEFVAKWRHRMSIDPLAGKVLHVVLERFTLEGGPVGLETIASSFPDHEPAEIYGAVARLDEKDLILVRNGQVFLAYPFSGMPTAFSVALPGDRQRYAVCAIDALGVPALLGQPVEIRSHCHHCGEPLTIHAGPDGPQGSPGIMVWVGERGDVREKGCSSL